MSGKVHKRLRRMGEELVPISALERDIVAHPRSDTTAFNSPNSVRGATRAMKKVFMQQRRKSV